MLRSFASVGILGLVLLVDSADAQWFNHRSPGIPRTADGKPDLSARTPATPDGKPDLSGVWTTDRTPLPELERLFPGLGTLAVPGDGPEFFNKYFLNVLADFKPENSPLRKEFVPLLMQRGVDGQSKDVPSSKCLPSGIPMGDLLAIPRRFVQAPGLLVILSESNPHRLIFTDGRQHPVDPQPAWLGYSVGSWEGDTLVVETRGFTDRAWLDAFGHPRSEAMRVTERLRRRDFGHIDVQVTIDDATTYTKPFSIRYGLTLTPDTDVLETVCAENERDAKHLVGK
jgi:hypothetical protein